jgi:hypothetical protein
LATSDSLDDLKVKGYYTIMGLSKITVCLRSVNDAIYTTTLHTVLNFGMLCKMNQIHLDVHINSGEPLPKLLKTCDRLIFIDYAVSIDGKTIQKLLAPFPDSVKVMVVPTVLSNIDWEKFKTKTRMGSSEPPNQRGLEFGISVLTREISPGVSEYSKGDGRIIAYDSKAVLKKMGSSIQLSKLKDDGIKIGVLNEEAALCHYTYECVGNILETSGIKVSTDGGPKN